VGSRNYVRVNPIKPARPPYESGGLNSFQVQLFCLGRVARLTHTFQQGSRAVLWLQPQARALPWRSLSRNWKYIEHLVYWALYEKVFKRWAERSPDQGRETHDGGPPADHHRLQEQPDASREQSNPGELKPCDVRCTLPHNLVLQ